MIKVTKKQNSKGKTEEVIIFFKNKVSYFFVVLNLNRIRDLE